MEKEKRLKVKLSRLDPAFLEWRTDKNFVKDSESIFNKLTKHHISTLIALQMPEFYTDFEDVPHELQFPGRNLRKSSAAKVVRKESVLVIEAKKVLKDGPVDKKRKTRYSGGYTTEQIEKNAKTFKVEPVTPKIIQKKKRKISVSSVDSSKPPSPGPSREPLKISINLNSSNSKIGKVKKRTLSSSSSSSSSSGSSSSSSESEQEPPEVHEQKLKQLYNPQQVLRTENRPMPASLKIKQAAANKSFNLAQPELSSTMNSSIKPVEEPKPAIMKRSSGASVPTNVTQNAPAVNKRVRCKNVPPKAPILIERPASANEEKKAPEKTGFKIPPLIAPPKLNPRTAKPLNKVPRPASKAPAKLNPAGDLKSLGGIFAVDNGWDKVVPQEKKILKDFSIPKIVRTQPVIETTAKIPAVRQLITTVQADDIKVRDKFNTSYDESESDEDDDVNNNVKVQKKSIFSDTEEENFQVTAEAEAKESDVEPEPKLKRQKISSEDEAGYDQEMVSKTQHTDDDDDYDRISLEAEDMDFEDNGDFEDSPVKKPPPIDPSLYTTELDELKMTVRKEPVLTAAEVEAEFQRNTHKIMINAPKAFDDITERVLKRFFGSICPKVLLENDCNFTSCKNNHSLPDPGQVRTCLQVCSMLEIGEAYAVASKFPIIIDAYVPLFAETFIKKSSDYTAHLARMIVDCERNAKSHQLYHHIVEALVTHGRVPRYKAIKLLIDHHTDSTYAQEAIMSMIVETGPDLIRLVDYLISVNHKRSIPNNILDKVISNCVTYQDPKLPMFCLNNLITKKPEQIRQLNGDHVFNFLKLQIKLTEENSLRESKAETLAEMITKLKLVSRAP